MNRLAIGIALSIVLATGAAAEPAWHTYTDAKRGFSIDYPDGWTVDPGFKDKGYGFFQGDTDDYRDGVALKPTVDLAPGTNLESPQLVLAIETARPADRCEARAFLVDPPPDYFTERPVDRPDAVRTVAKAGDLYTIEHIVLIGVRQPCIAAHYILVYGQGQGANAPPAFDHAAVVGLLNRIASTVKPLK
ncbi:MAG: hypothetical protein WDN01_19265 [Rhizomicrobium sp.]